MQHSFHEMYIHTYKHTYVLELMLRLMLLLLDVDCCTNSFTLRHWALSIGRWTYALGIGEYEFLSFNLAKEQKVKLRTSDIFHKEWLQSVCVCVCMCSLIVCHKADWCRLCRVTVLAGCSFVHAQGNNRKSLWAFHTLTWMRVEELTSEA